jgi:hypothetical protein
MIMAAVPTASAPAVPAASEAGLAQRLGLAAGATLVSSRVDLNRDGKPETVAYSADPASCGTGGCTLYVVDGATGRVVMRTTVARPPVEVLVTRSNGWRDLTVAVGGGGAPAHRARLSYDGRRYPTNASTAPVTTAQGRSVISADLANAAFAQPRRP